MAEQTMNERAAVKLASFTIEYDEPRNRTATSATLHLSRIRGAYSLAKLGAGAANAGPMAAMPDIPGLRLTVHLRTSSALLFDPLEKELGLLEQINSVFRKTRPISAVNSPTTFVPRTDFKLSADELKTLIEECMRKVEEGQARLVDGRLPTPEELDALPGETLYDQWNAGRKPRHRRDVPEWEERMRAAGD